MRNAPYCIYCRYCLDAKNSACLTVTRFVRMADHVRIKLWTVSQHVIARHSFLDCDVNIKVYAPFSKFVFSPTINIHKGNSD